MTERRIPVAEPVLGQEEMDNVMAAMKSGWISSLGAFIPEFERDFAAFSGAAHGVAVANGTVALHLALVAAGIGPGDEVLMPSLTFVATASAVRYCGAVPVFVDSDAETWQLDPAALAAKVTPRAKAVIPVHLYGHPCDMDPIRAIAARRTLIVIEDAAEAHGAHYRGRPVGALGVIGCFSFYGNKIITTGEGGMCLTNDPAMAEHLRLLRDHGMDPKRPYWHDIVGYNYRMTNLQAAVGVAQVKKIGGFIDKKREMAAWYAESLGPLAAAGRIRLQPEAPWARSVFWMNSVILADTPVSVEQVRARMSDRGVDTRPFFHPAHLLPPYATGERLPVAEHLSSRGLNLPSGTGLTRDQVERVARALAEALEARCARARRGPAARPPSVAFRKPDERLRNPMSWRIPVARPDIGPDEVQAVHAVMESGWITQGAKVRELEAAFARLCGTAHAVATNTGTAALHVALLGLDVGLDDEVITTPLSCIASANPILFQGARPVFVDVDPETYNVEAAQIAKFITARTRAILPVHLFGHPVDMDPLLELAAASGLPVIEDASQATGASYKGRRVGGFGHVGCFSLYANKIITSGEGGMLVTNDEALTLRMRAIRNFGQIPGQHFRHAFLGGNYKMTDVCAAIGCAQVGKIDTYIAARRRQVAALNAALGGLDALIERLPSERPWASAAPFGYHMLFRTAGIRQRAEDALHGAGIETRPFFSLITAEEPYRSMGFDPADTPVAADLVARGLYVSVAPDLTADDRAHIAETLAAVARAEGGR